MPSEQVVSIKVVLLCLLVVVGAGCSEPRHLILITVDTLRADRVGLYEGGTLPTPGIDRLGREGAVVEHCFAPFGRTTQSVGTIHTGVHPLCHGADGLGMKLGAANDTLAEILQRQGYETAAFLSNLVLRKGTGFEQGFDLYSNPRPRRSGNSATSINAEALQWLESRAESPGEPFFLWIHYLDPHWTYEPEPSTARLADPDWDAPFPLFDTPAIPTGEILFHASEQLTEREIEHARRLYDAEVADTDRAIGTLLQGLERLDLLDSSIVLLTSDHGESLGDHDYWFGHGEYLYDSTLRVPLIVRAPGLIPEGTRLSGVARLEEVAPTLLDLLGISAPDRHQGQSLAGLLRAGGAQQIPASLAVHLTDHVLVRPENPRRPVAGREGRWWAIRDGRLKLIRIPSGDGEFNEELYDLADDPLEASNLLDVRAADAERLRTELEKAMKTLSTCGQAGDSSIDENDLETLRGLGYAG